MKRIFLTLAFLLSWSICLADMPHVLKNGDTVDANQLNENFEHLKLLSLSGAYSGLYPTYANGVLIGKSIFNIHDAHTRGTSLIFNPDFEPVTLLKSGAIELQKSLGRIQYTENDCSGDKYVEFSNYPLPENFLMPPSRGEIHKDYISGDLYYYPPKVQTMDVKMSLSYRTGTDCFSNICEGLYQVNLENGGTFCAGLLNPGCREATQEEINIYLTKILIKLLPNDPAITGLPNAPFPTPITFGGIQEAIIE